MLEGKIIYFLGSSITYGFSSNGYAIPELIQDRYKAICIKNAISGTTLADNEKNSYYSRLINDKNNVKLDLFVCQLSTNDTNLPSFGDFLSRDEKTTIGSIRRIIEYVKNKWNCKIVFYTSQYFIRPKYEELMNIMYKVKDEYSDVYILDLFNDKEFNSLYKEEYMADDIHPTKLGYEEWWLPKFVDLFDKLI